MFTSHKSGNETNRISPSVYTNCSPNSYQFWLHRSMSIWIVLNCSAFYLVRPVPVPVTGVRYNSLLWMCTLNTLTWPDLVLITSLYIMSIRSHSYWFVYRRCAFLSIRCDSHWFVLVQSTHSYFVGVHRTPSYRIAPGKQHGPVRIRKELIGIHNDQIRTNYAVGLRKGFNSQDPCKCFEHFKIIVLALRLWPI